MLYEQTQSIPTIRLAPTKPRLWQRVQGALGNMLQIDAPPQVIARSFAIGTLISVLPTPGLNFALAALLATRFKVNKAGLLAAVSFWNALVVAPLYALSFQMGEWVFGVTPAAAGSLPLLQGIALLAQSFLFGNVMIALAATAVSYMVVKTAVSRVRKGN